MSDRTFTVTYTEAERLTVLYALGWMRATLGQLSYRHEFFEGMPASADAIIDKLKQSPGVEAKPGSGTETAKAILSPPPAQPRTPTDHFAKDRKGNIPVTPPKDAQLRTVNILQAKDVDRATPYVEVIFTGGKGNCFDRDLWPLLKKHQGQAAQIWTTVSKDGKYTNVVGVRE